MNPRILQYLQNALVTAVTVVLALVVLSAFLRVIRPPEGVAAPAGIGQTVTDTSIAADDGAAAGATTSTAAVDGSVTQTTSGVEPVCREPVPPAASGTVLTVFYPCGSGALPNPDTFVYRSVPDTDLVLTRTLEQMVLGPDEEEQALGFRSVFTEATTRAFASVRIESGRAIVDFTGLQDVEALTAPEAAEFFLATLGANVFQFDTISSAEYRLGGSCDAFYALLQRECSIVTRQSWNQQVAQWRSSG